MNKPDRYFRSRAQQIVTTSVMLVSAVYYAVTTYPERGRPSFLLPGILFGVASLIIAFRAARMGALCTEDHLVVRNIFKTFKVPWGRIHRFEYGTIRFFGFRVPVARLWEGETIPIGSYFMLSENPRAMQITARLIEDLNGELAVRR